MAPRLPLNVFLHKYMIGEYCKFCGALHKVTRSKESRLLKTSKNVYTKGRNRHFNSKHLPSPPHETNLLNNKNLNILGTENM